MKKLYVLLASLLITTMALTACGGAAATNSVAEDPHTYYFSDGGEYASTETVNGTCKGGEKVYEKAVLELENLAGETKTKITVDPGSVTFVNHDGPAIAPVTFPKEGGVIIYYTVLLTTVKFGPFSSCDGGLQHN